MSADQNDKAVRRFGPFSLDPKASELRRNGIRVRLQPQTLRLLLLLTARPGEVVTREQLRCELWDKDVFVEFEQALNFTVSQLRTALHDSATNPRFIETVPRRGYRFIQPVAIPSEVSTSDMQPEEIAPAHIEVIAHASATTSDVTAATSPRPWIGRLLGSSVAAVLLLSVAASALFVWRTARLRHTGGAEAPSIVILPFLNLTGDQAKTYLSDGVMEEIITRLATTEGTNLRVIARTSAVSFRDKPFTVMQIGRELNAQYVLEGSLQGTGNHVRVIAQLIRASDQTHVWAGTYDGDSAQLQEFEAAISNATLSALLGSAATAQLHFRVHGNPAAHNLYLKGLEFLALRSQQGFEGALLNFGQAVQSDPTNADAYAELAVTYNLMGQYNWMRQDEARSQGKAAALQALALDPSHVEAHAALAFSNWFYGWEIAAPVKELSSAVASEPNSVDARHWLAMALMTNGQFAEAEQQLNAAIRLDPRSSILRTNLGWLHYMERNFALSTREMNAVLEQNPNFLSAHIKLWYAYSTMGDQPHAWTQFQILSSSIVTAEKSRQIQDAYKRAGYAAALLTLVGEDDSPYGNEGDRARAFIFAGDRPRALEALQAGVARHDGWMVFVPTDPAFDALHSDPVYMRLVALIRNAPSPPIQADRVQGIGASGG